jgi:osmoprotectant transport system ATP-binding protein
MIIVQNLSKFFQQTAAVKNVSFEVEQGETLVLLGTSGSGKTTTLRMINRLIEPSSGEVFINGQNALALPAEMLRRSIGYVLQNNGLFPHYTVAENISIVPKLLGWEKNTIEARVRELLVELHLDPKDYSNRYPRELSGGQQQRVGLARALAANPPILLMDEPFGALDPVTRSSIRMEFLRLDELKRKTIVMVTHDIEEAFALGDKICLMDGGSIKQIGTPAELLFNPEGDFSRDFFGSERAVLEMKSLRITNIWPYLESAEPDLLKSSGQADKDETLWMVLQRLSAGGPQRLLVRKDNEAKTISLEIIFRSLKQLKGILA